MGHDLDRCALCCSFLFCHSWLCMPFDMPLQCIGCNNEQDCVCHSLLCMFWCTSVAVQPAFGSSACLRYIHQLLKDFQSSGLLTSCQVYLLTVRCTYEPSGIYSPAIPYTYQPSGVPTSHQVYLPAVRCTYEPSGIYSSAVLYTCQLSGVPTSCQLY